ncbi:CsbD family protein [Methylobacterium sp. A49B]|uniref:CsbD family protein n=1 Tax=Methylobacterium mesophilicum SR1.6/6 TaxID=908290 RepID=A0A6B9FK95_9HYPH|nr:CsbD family protein [Methylobacterium mesophilicum]MBE7199393.1 CsbD family protein [Parafilimonas terrae]QGY02389.1 CsbD family protein [Methylobacterium mesophilicum SR1.6/6]
MTDDKSSTSVDRRKGSIKEAIGKLTGDVRAEAEGKRQKRASGPSQPAETEPGGRKRG